MVKERRSSYKYYKIEEIGHGHSGPILTVIKAKNEKNAKAKAAKKLGNEEIRTTGFFRAKEISRSEIKHKISCLRKELALYENALNE